MALCWWAAWRVSATGPPCCRRTWRSPAGPGHLTTPRCTWPPPRGASSWWTSTATSSARSPSAPTRPSRTFSGTVRSSIWRSGRRPGATGRGSNPRPSPGCVSSPSAPRTGTSGWSPATMTSRPWWVNIVQYCISQIYPMKNDVWYDCALQYRLFQLLRTGFQTMQAEWSNSGDYQLFTPPWIFMMNDVQASSWQWRAESPCQSQLRAQVTLTESHSIQSKEHPSPHSVFHTSRFVNWLNKGRRCMKRDLFYRVRWQLWPGVIMTRGCL